MTALKYPTVFITGAPKCGTTTLYDWLGQHPDICAPQVKEPHHFFSPYGPAMDEESYLALFHDAGERRGVDASVWNLFSEKAVPKILATVADPKFIICLRSPIAMAPSLHYQKLFTGHEAISSFEAAWSMDAARRAGSFKGIANLPDCADPSHMAYQHACMLGAQVERLLGHVDRGQVHFCFLEDLATDPAGAFRALCNFLSLHAEAEVTFAAANPASGWRSNRLRRLLDFASATKRKLGLRKRSGLLEVFHKANRTDKIYAPPSPALKQEMLAAFRDDITLLSQLTARNLDHWLA
jgi:hypothetical protein